MSSKIGTSNPTYCTAMGKAMLAFQPAQTIEDIIAKMQFARYTGKTLCSRETLLSIWNGYAVADTPSTTRKSSSVFAASVLRSSVKTDGSLRQSVCLDPHRASPRPHGNAIGNYIRLSGDSVRRQIIGVVKNSNYTTLGEAPQPCLYLPLRQNVGGNVILYVRSAGDPSLVLAEVQRGIKEVDPGVQITDVRTGAKLVNQVLWNARIVLGMLGIFGLLSLALASVGLYRILAYSVSSRRREIGVRMALGASRLDVLRLVLRQGMTLVGIGVGLGLAISLLVGRAFSRMLFGLSPADPLSLIGASAILLLVAALACHLPALAASRMDPMRALREG